MTRSFRSLFCLLTLCVPLALAGCGNGSNAEEKVQEPAAEKVTNVRVQILASQDLQERFTLPGNLEAWEDLTLAAELDGPVRWIGPKEGSRLAAGEAILRIDPETQEANLASARTESQLKERTLRRLEELQAQKLVSTQEVEEARNEYEAAHAALQVAQVALAKSTLSAPVAGVLDRLLVDRGEYVKAGAAAAVLVQVDRLKVLVDVPEKDVSFLKIGDRVEVISSQLEGEGVPPRTGTLIHLAYRADPATRTYRAKIEVDNGDDRLRPGMIVRAGFLRRDLPNVIAVPLYALVDEGGRRIAFVEDNGVARLRTVVPGAVVGNQVVIREGLKTGERLIVQGQQLIGDGSRVAAGE
ncbi:RND family efflux transporter, MFP subunit [Desulfuromonas soudanensis]|uniref:RND family efflux transporter, MFP subunit n=1 Tax=Desulfuromonas soudanensis TaxID=1603606 RepID=A0A0M4DA40_9BACT|nr:efflux RND transporter periplasmic adaptor subunit [Desulfuromonas soudanensis]ALC16942.1 RND family efflux transporter, MFP subunit [Desulfuromonas soudanensis]